MTTVSLILGLVIAAVSSVAGIGAWQAARILSHIERQRRRAELPRSSRSPAPSTLPPLATPTCASSCAAQTLDTLDEVTIRILDERWQDHGGRLTPGGPSADDIAKHIWGPWEFNTGASAQVADNRTTIPRPYSRTNGKDWDHLSLIPTTPPYWASMTQQQWLRRTDGQPLRLLVSCRLADYVWELAYDVPVNVEPR